MFSAGRTADPVVQNKIIHFLIGPSVHRTVQANVICFCEILNQLVGAETLMALLAVHQRVGKSAQVSGSHPGLRIHQNRTVHPDIIRMLLDKFLPPGALDIIFKLYSQITVIPRICKTSVYFGTRINKSPLLCNLNDSVQCFFHYVALAFSFYL